VGGDAVGGADEQTAMRRVGGVDPQREVPCSPIAGARGAHRQQLDRANYSAAVDGAQVVMDTVAQDAGLVECHPARQGLVDTHIA
jgi:hypothetical protein